MTSQTTPTDRVEQKEGDQRGTRKEYRRPDLKCFGTLVDLTQLGGLSGWDGISGSSGAGL